MKAIKTGLLAVIGFSLIAVTAEADTILNQVIWSASCIIICAASAAILNHIEKKEEQSC